MWARAREDFARPQFKKQFTLGRSMTEMLGVLAIIGVLSIGALVGLKYAFMKHQSNLIIEDVKLAGFIVKDELFETLPLTEEKSLNAYFTPQTAYPFTTFKETESTYAVVVDSVPENVCLELKKRSMEWLEEIRANGQENTCRANNTNSMSFFFNTAVGTEKTRCRDDDEKPYYCNGACQKCPCGEIWDVGLTVCSSCNIHGQYVNRPEECHVCDSYKKMYASTKPAQRCYQCQSLDNAYSTKEECLRCGNRCYDSTRSQCFLFTTEMSSTECNQACPDGYYVWGLGGGAQQLGCQKCSSIGSGNDYVVDYAKCHLCPDTFVHEVGDPYLRCATCLATSTKRTTQAECKRCAKRFWTDLNDGSSFGSCALCPNNQSASSDGLSCI